MTKKVEMVYFGGATQTTEWFGNSGRNYTENYFGGVAVPPNPNDNFIPPDVTPPTKPLAWVGTPPATGTVGSDLVYNWEGGDISADPKKYNVVVELAGAEVDNKTDSATTYTFSTTGKAPGTYKVTVYDKGGKSDPTASKITVDTVLSAAPVQKTIAGKAKAAATGGDVVPFTDLFTPTNCAATDFDFVVAPTTAGSVAAATGALTLADDAAGKVEVTATAKSSAGTISGSPAKGTITLVTAKPKPKSISGLTIASATGGDKIAFNLMFTAVNCAATDFDFAVDGTPANGTVNATTGELTLIDTAAGKVTITATAKSSAGTVSGSPASCVITAVTAKP